VQPKSDVALADSAHTINGCPCWISTQYLSALVMKELEAAVERVQDAGVDVAVRHYKAA
jgi:hypothetical protein